MLWQWCGHQALRAGSQLSVIPPVCQIDLNPSLVFYENFTLLIFSSAFVMFFRLCVQQVPDVMFTVYITSVVGKDG